MKLGNRSIHKQSVNIVYKQGSKYVLWMEIEGESSPSTERQEGVVERVSTLVSDTLGFKSWLFHCVKLGALTFADLIFSTSTIKLLACAIVISIKFDAP